MNTFTGEQSPRPSRSPGSDRAEVRRSINTNIPQSKERTNPGTKDSPTFSRGRHGWTLILPSTTPWRLLPPEQVAEHRCPDV